MPSKGFRVLQEGEESGFMATENPMDEDDRKQNHNC